MLEKIRLIRSETTTRSEKTIKKERNHLEVKRPFEKGGLREITTISYAFELFEQGYICCAFAHVWLFGDDDFTNCIARLDNVKPKIIISRDVVFNESLMYKDTLKGAGAADSMKEVEFEVELQGMHDRAKRTTAISARYKDEGNVSLYRSSRSRVKDDMVAYAFAIAKEEDTREPIAFQEKLLWYPPNNLGPDLSGKAVNETPYRDIKQILRIHFIAVKRVPGYLKGYSSLGLWYPKCSSFDLKGYSDSDYAGCNMDRKSTSGACQLLGGKLVCWSAKKQQSVAMSSAKAEYVAAAGCCANILWMKSQLT
ncbi:hypothetical protein Tco_0658980 [Tanacetum coccineum]